jgi:hypothetical protein
MAEAINKAVTFLRELLPQGAQSTEAQEQAHDAQDEQNAQTQRLARVIKVRARGVQPEGPDQISYEEWENLGRELGRDCPRVKEFLRQRDAPPVEHLLS